MKKRRFSLWYGPLLVGHITEAFQTDGAWYGQFSQSAHPSQSTVAASIISFIGFCVEWNEHQDGHAPPDASGFDDYRPLLISGLWRTKSDGGSAIRLCGAPVFFRDGEVSWRVEDGHVLE